MGRRRTCRDAGRCRQRARRRDQQNPRPRPNSPRFSPMRAPKPNRSLPATVRRHDAPGDRALDQGRARGQCFDRLASRWKNAFTLLCRFGITVFPAWCGSPAQDAGNYPNKPVMMIVPFAPGGASDFVARIIQQGVGDILGQQIVVDNRPGAAGMIGTESQPARRRTAIRPFSAISAPFRSTPASTRPTCASSRTVICPR